MARALWLGILGFFFAVVGVLANNTLRALFTIKLTGICISPTANLYFQHQFGGNALTQSAGQ